MSTDRWSGSRRASRTNRESRCRTSWLSWFCESSSSIHIFGIIRYDSSSSVAATAHNEFAFRAITTSPSPSCWSWARRLHSMSWRFSRRTIWSSACRRRWSPHSGGSCSFIRSSTKRMPACANSCSGKANLSRCVGPIRLFGILLRSSVGTLFALPWFLTWFGHSLNSYRDVVRLYDYFLASPFLMPLYVTAAIVLYREDEIFKEDCDMASLHVLLSHVSRSSVNNWPHPSSLRFVPVAWGFAVRILAGRRWEALREVPARWAGTRRRGNDNSRVSLPQSREREFRILIRVHLLRKKQREKEAQAAAKRRLQLQRKAAGKDSIVHRILPVWTRRSVFMTTAFSIVVGFCAYYYKAQLISISSGISWNTANYFTFMLQRFAP